tara:strand:- start:22 stop:531 length:510 start_codon:yes stop_codon:yes gene_type:complete
MWFKALLNIVGIGGKALENRAKLKELKSTYSQEVLMAETKSKVSVIESQTQRVLSNDEADNRVDWEMTKQKANSWKDDVITYLVLTPLFIVIAIPLLTAYKTSNFEGITDNLVKSFASLSQLPEWYKWVLGAVIVDALAFRRIAYALIKKVDLSGFVKNVFSNKKPDNK